jgi:hypothetical protein
MAKKPRNMTFTFPEELIHKEQKNDIYEALMGWACGYVREDKE